MGRLTLNVLLSFAQFERELIGERVRDKIAASKRKGLWVGGPVPLGYAAMDKKIVVVPAEAEAVRTIFERYLALGSVRALAEDLDHGGIRSKPRQLANGRLIGGGAFGVGALAYLLKNRFYIGEVAYRGEAHRGDHAPILDRPLFEAVQAKLAVQTVARRCRLRGSPALLTGRLFDDHGNRMTPSHTNKTGVRYRYYVSQALLQSKGQGASRPSSPLREPPLGLHVPVSRMRQWRFRSARPPIIFFQRHCRRARPGHRPARLLHLRFHVLAARAVARRSPAARPGAGA
jgi:hypothetical protein